MKSKSFRIFLLLSLLAFSFKKVTAQKYVEYINSQDVLSSASEKIEDEKWNDAIDLYKKVPLGDTNYRTASYQVAYCNYRAGNYDKVIEQCTDILRNKIDDLRVYNIMASAYDKLKAYDKAISVYEDALKKYPYSETLKYNRILSVERKGEKDKAYKMLQELLMESPQYPPAHWRLAYYAETEGRLFQAIMAYATYLLISPDDNSSNSVLDALNKLSDNSSSELNTAKTFVVEKEFEDYDFLIANQVALNEKYKVPGKMTYPVNKQVYLMMEKAAKDNSDCNSFFCKFYLPFFKEFLKKNKYEYFSLLMLASSKNEYIQGEVKKNLQNIIKVRNEGMAQFRELHNGKDFVIDGKNLNLRFWYNDNHQLNAFGNLDESGKNRAGRWIFLSDDSYIDATGDYDQTGNRMGKWYFLGKGNDTLKTGEYSKGQLNGPYFIYHNHVATESGNYQNGKIDWLVTYRFTNGSLKMTESYVQGIKSGDFAEYFANEQLRYKYSMLNDKLNGPLKEYYDHGALKEDGIFKEGKRNGNYKVYHENGKLKYDYTYNMGEFEGSYKSYYVNGNIEEEGRAAKGKITGTWKEYYSNGNIREISQMDENGKNNGNIEYFNYKGVRYRIDTYIKGDWTTAKYFNPDGSVLYEWKKSKNGSDVEIYDQYLFKNCTGFWNNNKRQKEWKFFRNNGELSAIENYIDGKLDGEATSYSENGKIISIHKYKDNEQDGLQLSFFKNGNLEEEGHCVNGLKYGSWIKYTIEGTKESEVNYWEDNRAGWSIDYYKNGSPINKYRYENGTINYIAYCDTNGNIIDSAELVYGYGKVSLKGVSGKKYFTGGYLNGVLHGAQTLYYPNQQVYQKSTYFMGYVDGELLQYHTNGKLSRKRYYFHGDKTGTWENYNYRGEKVSAFEYKDAFNHGKNTWFYSDGKPETVSSVYEGKKHRASYYYAPDGQVRLITYFIHGNIIGYSYMGANGKPVDTIFLSKGDGHVKAFYPNGKVSCEFDYKSNFWNGPYKVYYPDGKLLEESIFEGGEEVAPTRTYYANGKLKSEVNYIQGLISGEAKEYNNLGILISKETYYNDELNGLCEYFDNTGKKLQSVYYVSGLPLWIK